MTSSRPYPLELDRTAFLDLGEHALAFIADYVDALATSPASASTGMEELIGRLVRTPPEQPETLSSLMDDFREAIGYGVNTAGSGYLAYFPAGGLLSAGVAELLANAANRYTAMAQMAPALVAMEHGVMRWLCAEFGLPEGSIGVATTGGSLANLTALVAARCRASGETIGDGTLYVSAHTHFSVARAAMIAGLRSEQIRVVPDTDELTMDAHAAAEMIAADRAAGKLPFFMVATAGTTSTGSVDPLAQLAAIAARENVWLHVDAAYGGGFQLTERGRMKFAGIEQADSITFDPHKSLFLPYGTGVLLVRDAQTLHRAYSMAAVYTQDIRPVGELPDYGYLGPELTREFRGLRLWLPLHLHGVAAFRDELDEKLDLATMAYETLRRDSRFDVPWPPELSVVVFRLRDRTADTRQLLRRVNGTGKIFLSSTEIKGDHFLRLCVLNFRAHEKEVQAALAIIQRAADPDDTDHEPAKVQ